MAEIIIGERVINKAKETGTIISHDDKYICVDLGNRTAKFPLSAFDQGFLKYEKTDLQTLKNFQTTSFVSQEKMMSLLSTISFRKLL
jgi:hypothetical protein